MSASNSSASRSGSADTTLARSAGRLLVPMAPGAYSAIMTWTSGPLGSRVDLLLLALGGADLDLPRLRLLGDRDPQRQDTGVVAGGDVAGVERLTEEQLAGEHTDWALGNLQLDVVARHRGTAFGLDGHDVALHVQLDGVRRYAREVERHHELVTDAIRVHGHRRRPAPRARDVPQHLLGQAVQLSERVGTHQHRKSLLPRRRRSRCTGATLKLSRATPDSCDGS